MISNIIKVGDKVDLIKIDTDYKERDDNPVYVSQVLDFVDEEHLNLAMPIESWKVIPLQINDYYSIFFYSSKGLFQCKAQVTDRYMDENKHILTVKILTKLEKYQRRKYYRLNCIMEFNYITKDNEDKLKEGLITDISGGGLRFTSSDKLSTDSDIRCQITINANSRIVNLELIAKVITSSPVVNQTNKYDNRVQFTNITLEERELIIKHIFEEERKRRKKEKGLE